MNHYLAVAATVIAILVLVEAAKYLGKLSWSYRSKVPNLATVKVPLWSVLIWLLPIGLFVVNRGCDVPAIPWPVIATPGQPLVVLMYEADHGPLPAYAIGAANELSAAGVDVRPVDDDVVDGTGETPDWLKPAIEPGRAVMGADQKADALIVLRGGKVAKAVALPATREAIVEAAK